MLKVYVVYQQCFYLGEPEKVFSTRELAEAWVVSQKGNILGQHGDNGYHIDEFEVENAVNSST